MVPLVRTIISVPAGIVRVPIGRFTLMTLAGSTIWCWALAMGGYILGEHWEEMREITRPFDIPIILALLALLGIYIYRHLRKHEAQS